MVGVFFVNNWLWTWKSGNYFVYLLCKKWYMTRKEIAKQAIQVYNKVINYYGESKYHDTLPDINLESKIHPKDPQDLIGEYCPIYNEITLYWKNIPSTEVLIRVLVHEYQHYLQSPTWMTRYWNMGHEYGTHPYEVQAWNEEENWVKFV
jgi:hypothetical protein